MTMVYTFTLSSGHVLAVYRQISAGEAIITIVLLAWLGLELANLVREYA